MIYEQEDKIAAAMSLLINGTRAEAEDMPLDRDRAPFLETDREAAAMDKCR